MAAMQTKDPIENKGRKTYALPSIVVLDVSRLGSVGREPAEASWTGKFQDQLATCQLGNLDGALVVRSELDSEILEPLCWRVSSRWLRPPRPCRSAAGCRRRPGRPAFPFIFASAPGRHAGASPAVP
jgi:hypothetical protein